MNKSLVTLILAGLVSVPALAQESPRYKVKESVLNAGGHPANGTVVTSPRYRIKLDAIGESVVAAGLASASYRMDAGFAGAYPPPGEVQGLRFESRTRLRWNPEKSVGTYAVYTDGFQSLFLGGEMGLCLTSNLTDETVEDARLPQTGDGFFYLVTARNRLREEGTKGYMTDGTERNNPEPCP